MRTVRPTGRRVAALVALLLLLVLATGCQARLTIDIAVDRDGAGELAVALGADAALLAEVEAAGADPLADLAATGRALEEEGWRTTDVTADDGGRTVTLVGSFDSPATFNSLAAELGEALAGPELAPLEALSLTVTDEEIRLSGDAALVPGPAVTELGLQPEQAVALLRDTEAVVYEVAVTLPGAVLATTAPGTTPESGRLRWRIPPGERVELLAVSDRPTAWWALAAAGSAAGVLLLLALAALHRWAPGRRRAA